MFYNESAYNIHIWIITSAYNKCYAQLSVLLIIDIEFVIQNLVALNWKDTKRYNTLCNMQYDLMDMKRKIFMYILLAIIWHLLDL